MLNFSSHWQVLQHQFQERVFEICPDIVGRNAVPART
jgi:hypothetical protein